MKHNHETTINAAALSVQWELPAPPLSNHPRAQSGREWICILLCSEKRHLFIVRVKDGSSLLISIVETYVPFTRNPLPEKWKQPDGRFYWKRRSSCCADPSSCPGDVTPTFTGTISIVMTLITLTFDLERELLAASWCLKKNLKKAETIIKAHPLLLNKL